MSTWNNYFLPLIMLNSPELFPFTVGLASWQASATAGCGFGGIQARHPFGVYLMRVYAAETVDDSLLEAARIDGAGELSIFFTGAEADQFSQIFTESSPPLVASVVPLEVPEFPLSRFVAGVVQAHSVRGPNVQNVCAARARLCTDQGLKVSVLKRRRA